MLSQSSSELGLLSCPFRIILRSFTCRKFQSWNWNFTNAQWIRLDTFFKRRYATAAYRWRDASERSTCISCSFGRSSSRRLHRPLSASSRGSCQPSLFLLSICKQLCLHDMWSDGSQRIEKGINTWHYPSACHWFLAYQLQYSLQELPHKLALLCIPLEAKSTLCRKFFKF